MQIHGREADRLVLVGIAALTLFIGIRSCPTPVLVGAWLDDSIYLATAKSIADGNGYRHGYLPEQQYQTKYPILWPALLSLIWTAWARFPDNLAAVVILNCVLTGAGVALCYLAMRRAWGVAWWLAAAASLLTILSNAWVGLMLSGMSEPLFLCLTGLGLWLAAPRAEARRAGVISELGAAVALAASYLTRAVGITSIGAVVVGALLRRRWRQAAIVAACGGAMLAAWSTWRAHADRENARLATTPFLAYDLRYADSMPDSTSVALRRVRANSADVLLSLLEHASGMPSALVVGELRRGGGSVATLYAAAGLIAALMVAGAIYWWRAAAPEVHLYVILTFAILSVWPWALSRSLAPLLPFLFVFLLTGVCLVIAAGSRLIAGARDGRATTPPGERSPVGAAPHAILLLVVAAAALPGVSRIWSPYTEEARAAVERRGAVAALLRKTLPDDARVAVEAPAMLHLHTGAKCLPPVPALWSEDLHSPPDAAWYMAGRIETPGLDAARSAMYGEGLVDFLRAMRVTHIVSDREETALRIAMRRLSLRWPGLLRAIGQSPSAELLQVTRPIP